MSRAFRARSRDADHVLTAAALVLCAIGVVLIWSSAGGALAARQSISVAVGLVVMLVVARLDPRRWAWAAYALGIGLLAAVFTPLGVTVNGARSWLEPGMRFQPAEFAKVALVAAIAVPLARRRAGCALLVALPLMGLIMLEPDLGTTLVYAAVVAGAVLVSGARRRVLLGLAAAGAVAAAVLGAVARPYQVDRLVTLLHPEADPYGAGYSATQARIAIGSGGFSGRGLFQGAGVVPEQHTDFIFTVAGEEFGFVGTVLVLALLGVVLLRGLRIAAATADPYGKVVAGGVVCWLGFQTFVNLGMSVGLVPVIGLPLPLVSYGGSAMVSCLAAIGLLQAVRGSRP